MLENILKYIHLSNESLLEYCDSKLGHSGLYTIV